MNSHPAHWHIGLVGYGEVGRILAEDLRAQGCTVSAYDRKLDAADTAPWTTAWRWPMTPPTWHVTRT